MNNPKHIEFELVLRGDLSPAQVAAMFRLLDGHFDGVTPEQFARDLAEKNLVLLLKRDDALAGFSTLLAYTAGIDDEKINVIYSGDTIVAPEAWGTMALPRAWVAGVEALRGTLPEGPCYWLLLTSGFRTYRFLPVFWREFYPRHDRPTPARTHRLLNQLARRQFGSQFDEPKGLIKFHTPQRLRRGMNEVPDGRTRDPHVSFFLDRNPGHGEGDELVCLTEISPGNLTAAGRRMCQSANRATVSCQH